MGKTMKGHRDAVMSLAVDWVAWLALSGSADWTIRTWDLHNGSLMESVTGHKSSVTGLVAEWTSRRALSCSADKTLEGHDGGVLCLGVSTMPAKQDNQFTCDASVF